MLSNRARSFLPRSHLALSAVAGPSKQPFRRGYASPVNPNTSVDTRLGTHAPAAPSAELNEENFAPNPRPNNPNDLSEFLRDVNELAKSRAKGGPGISSKQGTIQSVKGTAIGAQRRGMAIPSDNLTDLSELDAESRQRIADAQEDGDKGPINRADVDRESPHSIDQMQGRNELDERVLSAARAICSQRAGASLQELNDQYVNDAYRVLPIELPYESAPEEKRRVLVPNSTQESTPPSISDDDGILLIAFVDNVNAPRGKEKISVCTGFAVEGGEELAAHEGTNTGHLIVTVAHTLRSSIPSSGEHGNSEKKEASAVEQVQSAALAVTRNGLVFPIHRLVSSLPNCDLALLQLAKEPLPVRSVPEHQNTAPAPSEDKAGRTSVKTLPISPYPAITQSHLLVSSFWGFEDDSGCSIPRFSLDSNGLAVLPPSEAPSGRSAEQVKSEGDSMNQSRWGEVRLVEYKDGKGSEAQPGTYDSLETLEYKLVPDSSINPAVLKGEKPAFLPPSAVSVSANHRAEAGGAGGGIGASPVQAMQASQNEQGRGLGGYGVPNFPPPGSSGGPIVDMATGAVVGVTRGSKMTALGGRRGEGIPSEKIFEFFTLPGMGKNKKKV